MLINSFHHQNRFGEIHHYITFSTMDPLQWMGAVSKSATADKNITIIHTTPVHQLPSSEEKSCMFAKNHNHHLWWKYTSIIMRPPAKKVHPLLSSQNICLELFWTVFTGAWSADFSPDSDCFTGESIWKEDSSRSNGLKIETFNDGFVSYKLHNMLIDILSGVDYLWIIVMFLSAVWTLILTDDPFTGEDPFVSKWSFADFLLL